MKLLENSLSIVIVGYWNKYYMRPDWIATNIFESDEMNVSVGERDGEFFPSYENNNIIIKPTESRVALSAINISDETIDNLSKYANNWIDKATTPELKAYGLNAIFVDDDSTILANIFDSIIDTTKLIEMGYSTNVTSIKRKLLKEGHEINLTYEPHKSSVYIKFNEHHSKPIEETFNITSDSIKAFVLEAKRITLKLGYEDEMEEG